MSYDDYDIDAAEQRFDADIEQMDRIAELESLVCDMWCGFSDEMAEKDYFSVCAIRQRMKELGLVDGDAE